ncbi:3053_t:CDS:2 [Funneliformis caledonium]|uniref:3053_t:CDS:1 n=1 Tax=Funneliformis caledonium TaxID=1117310 RepID=A0A9N9AXM8_9GLOM|nr:3053_t:CDS:2 [Funneliformis caledonium]
MSELETVNLLTVKIVNFNYDRPKNSENYFRSLALGELKSNERKDENIAIL